MVLVLLLVLVSVPVLAVVAFVVVVAVAVVVLVVLAGACRCFAGASWSSWCELVLVVLEGFPTRGQAIGSTSTGMKCLESHNICKGANTWMWVIIR